MNDQMNTLKDARVTAYLRIKACRWELNEGPHHWRDDYRKMNVAEIRAISSEMGINPKQTKNALIDALITQREQGYEQEIDTLIDQIKTISLQITAIECPPQEAQDFREGQTVFLTGSVKRGEKATFLYQEERYPIAHVHMSDGQEYCLPASYVQVLAQEVRELPEAPLITPQEIQVLYKELKAQGLSSQEIKEVGIAEVRRRRDVRIRENGQREYQARCERELQEIEYNRRMGNGGPGCLDLATVLRNEENERRAKRVASRLWKHVWYDTVLPDAKGVLYKK